MEVDIPKQGIILFDGVCHLCNKSVQFILQRDRKGAFLFASLQSKVGHSLLSSYRIPTDQLHSIVLIEGGHYYTESTAILRICKRLDGWWKGLYLFVIIPKPIRDLLYRWFAKYRYKLFGKNEACVIPAPEIRNRFLDADERIH
nr:thiol-disulfide oxidoreductase DCC family protein [Caldalkalibacillus uzonensis]